tara:strand:- start:86 stop:250 length:165 start_codon:yes stop_codon:yes gene_type:complete
MTELEVNKKLNREYPKLLQAVHSSMHEDRKKAVVYKFIETLQDLAKVLDSGKTK